MEVMKAPAMVPSKLRRFARALFFGLARDRLFIAARRCIGKGGASLRDGFERPHSLDEQADSAPLQRGDSASPQRTLAN
ncbi:unnamed protein product, partial [Symbiodinium sp. KB8]